jgi:putative ABC transport system permease protein
VSVIYHKIWSDLWHHKARTLQVVLIVAMGALAIGVIFGAKELFAEAITDSWRGAVPPTIQLAVSPTVDDDDLVAIENIEGVAEAEGRMTGTLEWRLDPTHEWQPGGLNARDDYADQKLATLDLVAGEWPRKDSFAVEVGADSYFGVQVGDQVHLRINDREQLVKVAGYVSNTLAQSPGAGGDLQFYTTRERFEELTGQAGFNLVHAAGPVYDELLVAETADRIEDYLEKEDIEVRGAALPYGDRTADPNAHFVQPMLDGVFLLMNVVGGLIVVLGLFLIYNTINAVVKEQINQIGVMKAVGGRIGQILWAYLATVLVYGMLAAVIAVPLGAIAAHLLAVSMLGILNIDGSAFAIARPAVLAQVAVALLSPLVASLIPILSGVGITVREAISTYGLDGTAGLIDRLVAKAQGLPYTLLLTIGNTFRNKKRVSFTLITLVGGGVVFMMVIGVSDSTNHTFTDEVSSVHKYDVTLRFEEPERIGRVDRMALEQPGVTAVEMWAVNQATIRPASQAQATSHDDGAMVFGVPVPTTMYAPQLRAGRWLQPADTHAVVLSEALAEEIEVGLDDWVAFDHGSGRESNWHVVGLVFDPLTTESAHVSRDSLAGEIGGVNKANSIWVRVEPRDPETAQAVARDLRQLYTSRNISVAARTAFDEPTRAEIGQQMLFGYNIIVVILAVLAGLMALVGGIGLSGVLSLSVLERRREIGVMRAIGASSAKIARIFMGEGLTLGILSWLVALPLSVPAAFWLTQALGSVFENEIVYRFSPWGAFYWLAFVIALALGASWFPARSAVRVSVRESLAY